MAVRSIQQMLGRVASGSLLVAAGCLLAGCEHDSQSDFMKPLVPTSSGKCARMVSFDESFVTGNASQAYSTVSPNMIQHNLQVSDRVEGYVALIESGMITKVEVHRCFENDEFTFGHSAYTAGNATAICMDLYRWNRGLIAEHWDNCQVLVDSDTNPHTMVDGPTEACCQEETKANVAAVEAMQREVFIAGRVDNFDAFFSSSYIQHNQNFADGTEPLIAALRQLEQLGSSLCLSPKRVVGFGNYVLHTCLALANPFDVLSPATTVNWDLFRMEGGKIAEHWDVVASIPDVKDWANQNGKF